MEPANSTSVAVSVILVVVSVIMLASKSLLSTRTQQFAGITTESVD